jgi:peptide/nickel transport system substrate-binding protein
VYQADPVSWNPLLSLAYDGLVAYRRAGGSAGGTLVADLARELPEPSDDGRTYRFRLRPNVRFSNGAPVRPADVRASLERLLALTSPSGRYVLGYLPIRGAARCSVKRCDLAKGIETDAAARTVTIHLSRPNVDFLHNLQLALVVPAGSPTSWVTTRPLPGTGPYMIKRWAPRRGGLLVRNPHFEVWSPDRPDGFPDQIAQRYDRPKAQIAAVDHGVADIALLDSAIRSVAQLRTRYGARLHTDPAANTMYVSLNVRAPPFDDVRVRRALNYAVDRGRAAALLGAPETQQPTCQMLPPGFQGYTPSCRFTANPNRAGIWTGPDLAKARRLIAATGTRGMRIEFWGTREWEPLSRYFQSLLRDLGYRSELRTFPDLHLVAENATREPPRPQLGVWGWIADSAGAFSFLNPLFSCSGDTNMSRFCDPKLDAQMEEAALASGPEATKKWRRVEAVLAAQAPAVPLANASDIALVAERVGNYQHHPLWGPLVDQLWVK